MSPTDDERARLLGEFAERGAKAQAEVDGILGSFTPRALFEKARADFDAWKRQHGEGLTKREAGILAVMDTILAGVLVMVPKEPPAVPRKSEIEAHPFAPSGRTARLDMAEGCAVCGRPAADAVHGRATEETPANIFLVGVTGDGRVAVQRRFPPVLTKGEALNLAAWLVALASDGPDAPMFHALLRGVLST